MPHDYRSRNDRNEYYEDRRRDRMQWGQDQDAPQDRDDRRYIAGERAGRYGFEGRRGFEPGGYTDERGRREWRERDDREQQQRYRSRDDMRDLGSSSFLRGGADEDWPRYFGTGVHYGGGYSTAPGTHASGAGSWGATGFAGRGAFSNEEEWVRDDARNLSGDYENYGRSEWGAQSGYGREYGPPSYGEQRIQREPERTAQSDYGMHRGRGPKGYERSDARLREIICERLTDDPRIDASEVNVEVNQKIVKLTGTVPYRRMKHTIEDVIEHCGAKDIDNQVRVQPAVDPRVSTQAAIVSTSTNSTSTRRS